MFYSLGYGATTVTSYCDIIYHGSIWVTFLSTNSTIWHHISTKWWHNSSNINNSQYWKILSGQYDILRLYAPLLKIIWPGIDQSALSINVWHNNIQIWTCDEGHVEFYGSEATIFTEVKQWSILIPKNYKTHIVQHHRSTFALLYNIICIKIVQYYVAIVWYDVTIIVEIIDWLI